MVLNVIKKGVLRETCKIRSIRPLESLFDSVAHLGVPHLSVPHCFEGAICSFILLNNLKKHHERKIKR
jgi:hypothetical protein